MHSDSKAFAERPSTQGRGSCLASDVEPGVDVRRATEIPGESRPLHFEDVPNAVVADVTFLEISQPELVNAAVSVEAGTDFLDVASAEGAQDLLDELADHRFLLAVDSG